MTEIESVEAVQGGDCGGDNAGEAVARKGNDSEFGEFSDFRWDGAGDDAGGEDELSQLGEIGNRRREVSGETGGTGERRTE